MTNQTTTEELRMILKDILEDVREDESVDPKVDEILQLVEAEKKAVLEAAELIHASNPFLSGYDLLKRLQALSHSQEERELPKITPKKIDSKSLIALANKIRKDEQEERRKNNR